MRTWADKRFQPAGRARIRQAYHGLKGWRERASIYVPEELKTRMDRIGEAANWSEIVRPAILSEVATLEHLKGANMTTVIERLKASREKYVQQVASTGKSAGRAWASDRADYRDLKVSRQSKSHSITAIGR